LRIFWASLSNICAVVRLGGVFFYFLKNKNHLALGPYNRLTINELLNSPFSTMRYEAIDFYRGVTIAFMIIVNSPGLGGYVYPPLQHAAWHGCTPTDLVFPSFMFIIGVSMWFSFERYGRRWSSELGWKILNRVSVLFLIGLLLNKFPIYWKDWDAWRVWGVPQRLALGYGLAAVLVLNLSRKWLIWASVLILVGYWTVLNWGGVAGFDPYALDTNAVLRLDRWMLGEGHLWHGEAIAFDPEGLLSTFPAVVTVVLGWLSGTVLSARSTRRDMAVRDLLFYGILCGFVGMAWDLFFPINKKLWTSSYVLYAGGISMLLLAGSVWLFDVRKWRFLGRFFNVFGTNALFSYVLSEVLLLGCMAISWVQADGKRVTLQEWIFNGAFGWIQPRELASAAFAVALMLVCWLCAKVLYDRRVFLKV
jgi:predicted acyltransferase